MRFQEKNLDFLLNNVDFLLKNVDFLLKNLDFLLKNLRFYRDVDGWSALSHPQQASYFHIKCGFSIEITMGFC